MEIVFAWFLGMVIGHLIWYVFLRKPFEAWLERHYGD